MYKNRTRNSLIAHILLITCLFSYLCISPYAFSQSQTAISRDQITDIAIEGNSAVSTKTILSKVKLRVGDRFSQKAVNEDIKRLYAMGFFTDVTAQIEDYEGGTRLIFSVVEKSVIESITYEGNKIYREKVLAKHVETKVGDVLNKRRLSEDTKKIKAYYKKNGFPLVEVDYDVEVDNATNKAKVCIKIKEQKRYRIKSITFEGNKEFNDKRLLKVISTRPDMLFTSGFLDEETLEQDMERLEEFYKSEGYIDVKTDKAVEYNEKDEKIYINIKIEEGDKYFTGEIVFVGNTVVTDKEIINKLKMKSTAPYSPEDIQADAATIQSLYFNKGYMSCVVRPNTRLSEQKKAIDITYDITEGEISYVNEVKITGNTKTKDTVIRRELRLYPGDKFDGDKLKRSKQKLYDLGFFDEVIFETEPTAYPDKKDLVVSVKEAKTGEFSFGGGYSSVDRLIGFVEVTQRNFDIANFPTFTGAGQNLNIRAEIGSIRQNYVLSFTEPWIFGYPYLFGFDLFNYSRDRESSLGYGFSEKRTGGDLRFGKDFTDYDNALLTYRLEKVDISDVVDYASSALKEEEGSNTISSMSLRLTHDTTDSKFNPTEGYILSATGEDAGGVFGGDKDFYKLEGVGNLFHNIEILERKLVFDYKVRAGWANEYGDSQSVPIYERYYAGGANTVRGYRERGIGPRDSETLDPIGGEAMLIGNAEVTYPVIKEIKLAAFYDIGNVWADSGDFGNGGYKSGVGTGVRVKTPIGPVKLDMGYPLDKANPNDVQKVRFHFSMTRGF